MSMISWLKSLFYVIRILANSLHLWLLIHQLPCKLHKNNLWHMLCLSPKFIQFSFISMLYFLLGFLLINDLTMLSLLTILWLVCLKLWHCEVFHVSVIQKCILLPNIHHNHMSGKSRSKFEWHRTFAQCHLPVVIGKNEISQSLSLDFLYL